MARLIAAVDVGTGSARAGVFDARGRMLGRGEVAIETRVEGLHAEQDSEEIWAAVCAALAAARDEAGAGEVAGLAFDATCSLVLRDAAGAPVAAGAQGGDRWDTVLWLDHRARAEAEECTRTGHRVLEHLGGVMSPEMAIPKLMWLKRHLPASWARAARIMDLSDYLAWRANGTGARSVCTLACKWGWAEGWPEDFLVAVGLGDLAARTGVPQVATPVGADLGPVAAAELAVGPGARLGCGLIDAHAGALGVLGHLAGDAGVERRLALIGGTSSCLMGFAPAPRPAPGLWGPHRGVALPGLWLREGGQSVSGALLDHVIRSFGGGLEPTPATHARIAARIGELRAGEPDLAGELHVLPDFRGNRAPLADARALGMIAGLDMGEGFDALCRLYWRTAVGLALGLRQILAHFAEHGVAAEVLHAAGGHARSPMLMALYADATGVPVVEPAAPDPVLLGTAMVAATAAGLYPDLGAAARAKSQGGVLRRPDPAAAGRMARDWRAFQMLQRQRAELAEIGAG